jgi:hypothetical protein
VIVDFSSRPPVAPFDRPAPHLDNYRRVYRASEARVADGAGAVPLAEYLAAYERLDARRVVIKARDLETTFGFRIANEDVAAFCRAHGPRFVGFAGVDPHKGAQAVHELEHAVRELGMIGLNLQCFEHQLDINDPRLDALYAKCLELDIPVNIHCGINFSTRTAMTHGRPELLDDVMMRFPALRVCASPPGWPWVTELIAVAWRHPNVWIGLVAVSPRYLAVPGSGYEPLLRYGASLLQDRIIFGSSFPMLPVERSVREVRELPLSDDVREKWLHGNASRFLRLDPAAAA